MRGGISSPNLFFAAAGLILLLVVLPRITSSGLYAPSLVFGAVCLLLLLLLALPRIASWLRGRGRPVLSIADVEALLLGAGALVVDLREEKAFRMGHIRGCLHVPFVDMATRFTAPDPKASRDLVLVDETDALSHQAYDVLAGRGFIGVHVMQGGMKAWRRASLPLAK